MGLGWKHIIPILLFGFWSNYSFSQNPPIPEINSEDLTERLLPVQDEDLDYESIYEALFQLYQNPIDINKANAETLQATYLLTPIQIHELITYRNKFGPFLSLYELQAVPEFDQKTIEAILPFIQIGSSRKSNEPFWQRVREEENTYLLFRSRRVWETRKGFTPPDTSSNGALSSRYLGDPNDLYLRWRIQHIRDFSIGITLDKDAGEEFTWDPKTARYGANFFSFHFTRYQVGNWKTISIGDYKASFGQGLVFGAGYSLGKGAETVPTVRKSSVGILPYTAALEFGFFRGAAATYSGKNWEATLITSYAPRDGRASESLDSLEQNSDLISSFNQSGLHRTVSELSTKNQFRELSLGGNFQVNLTPQITGGINFLHTGFNHPWIRDPKPYNQFEFKGQSNQIGSTYFNANWKNFFLFGETAISKSKGTGTILGFISSLSKQVDISFLWRNYDKNFHTFYGNGFAESTRPINEKGTYLGLEIRPISKWKINLYYDYFSFPWLKYRVFAPSDGHEWLARLTYKPYKTLSAYIQIRNERKARNLPDSGEPSQTYKTAIISKTNGIFNLDFQVSKQLYLRSRVLWSNVDFHNSQSHGFMILQDVKFGMNRWRITGRYALFDTDDYDSRIYTFENNVLWTFSIPAFSGQGQRFYLIGQYDLGKKTTLYLRFARTTYTDRDKISSGLQEIDGPHQTESSFLIRYFLNR
ncbi:ComEA family DNA-binding protein [Algoriphagus zhangzhouensis]|uniref:Helix-hairpin-helix motif-containing protein n=1 Tax=Algoriphagus zhangzhouensis TaxID=1073327 RepID=A0A1M7Z3I1_9BACT|nr:helix-hairpin-helix domain-containing protein [Algoriphagus zhangzhouensis]TDY48404.1 helix-hairpin-helix protein [Algoriphagus zhangzhouensis]SHO59451.1 Helix-hairpin-helix motif-containing protein [Algoriphagus zhangzhouensis]